MMIVRIKEMEVLVQLASKKIIQYDTEGKNIHVYNSIKECAETIGISTTTLSKRIKNQEFIKGYIYKIKVPEPAYEIVKCENCRKDFKCQKFRIKEHKHLFCCKKCEGEWKKSQTIDNCVCSYCGKNFHRKESHIKKYIKNYCSQECANKDKKERYKGDGNHQFGLKGEKNASWKSNERISFYGYKLIRQLNHPFKNTDDFVFEHRLVAEEFLLNDENYVEINDRKYLSPKYVVHHIDFNRLNNAVTNLCVMERDEHCKLHRELKTVEDYKKYSQQYKVSYDTVIKNHEYNKKHYKWKKTA